MTDSTKALSEILHGLALSAPVGGQMPARLRRRAHFAMIRIALGATLLVVALSYAGFATYEGLTRPRATAPAAEPSVAPDRIAFVSDRDGDADIYSTAIDSPTVESLTENEASDVSPSWSPDGAQIAFSSDRSGKWDVYVMNADGSGVHRVVSNATHPSWSPDGTRIAFVRPVAQTQDGLELSQIFVLPLSTGTVEQVTHGEAGAIHPAWSSDGRRLAYSGAQGHIVTSDADGGNERRVTDEFDLNPLWTPEGTLVFARETSLVDDRVRTNVFTLDQAGGNARALTDLTGRSVVPESFSPDGSRLLVTVYEDGAGDLYTMNRDGGNLTPVVESGANDAEGMWRPAP